MWAVNAGVPQARRELARAVLAVVGRWGYEEQALPAWLDYEGVRPALNRFAGEGCKFIGPDGDVRVLLPDATLGVLTLWQGGAWPRNQPVRAAYEAEVYRSVGGPWRRVRQVGVELLYVPGAAGDAEVLATACEALRVVPALQPTVVLNDVRIAGAIAALAARAAGAADAAGAAGQLVETLARGDFVTLENILSTTLQSSVSEQVWGWLTLRGPLAQVRERLAAVPAGPEAASVAAALGHLAEIISLVGGPAPMVDLGLLRDLGYYDSFVFQVVAAATGGEEMVAGGGRYDGLFSALDAPVPAAGFALDLDVLARIDAHQAPQGPDYVVVAQGEGQILRRAWQEAARLRGMGFNVVMVAVPDVVAVPDMLAMPDSKVVPDMVAAPGVQTAPRTEPNSLPDSLPDPVWIAAASGAQLVICDATGIRPAAPTVQTQPTPPSSPAASSSPASPTPAAASLPPTPPATAQKPRGPAPGPGGVTDVRN